MFANLKTMKSLVNRAVYNTMNSYTNTRWEYELRAHYIAVARYSMNLIFQYFLIKIIMFFKQNNVGIFGMLCTGRLFCMRVSIFAIQAYSFVWH